MKIRNGFVSNSSSSSFILGLKKGANLKKELTKGLKLKGTLFDKLEKDLIKCFIDQCSQPKSLADFVTAGGYISVEHFKSMDFWGEKIVRLLEEGYGLYQGSFSDQANDYIEAFLCEMPIDYQDEKIVIYKEGGY